MKGKYEEIMDKVEITQDMRSRILKNINEACVEQKPRRVLSFRNWKRYSSVAAAAVLILIGAFSYRQINLPSSDHEIVSAGFAELGSLQELEKTVDFSMEELENLPFEATETSYIAYGNETAEINYYGEEQRIIYTKSTVIGGNNGHYETYETEKTVTYQGIDVTVKENTEGAYIVTWVADDFAYMIYTDTAMKEEALLSLIP